VDALVCRVCGDQTQLDAPDVVSSAQIATFVDAHCLHATMSIEFCEEPSSTARLETS
jgi:hypothetical protein